jgi:hypothetical protein
MNSLLSNSKLMLCHKILTDDFRVTLKQQNGCHHNQATKWMPDTLSAWVRFVRDDQTLTAACGIVLVIWCLL